MLKKTSVIVLAVMLFSGCATQPRIYSEASPVVEKIDLVRPPVIQSHYQLLAGNDPALEKAFSHYIRTGKATNIMTEGFVRFAFNGDQQPIVMTNPLQETVISLEPGERFTNVTTGDPARWSYSAAVSGAGLNQQFNILVKPSLPQIATNMVITTDRRIYNLRVISTENGRLTRNVRFWYPDEMVASINQDILKKEEDSTVAQVPDVNLKNLNFDYCFSTDGFFKRFPSWKPVRVFDDGVHTYIEFPTSMTNRDMPVLFIKNRDSKQLVNYRAKASYFIVDKIFKEAVLVMGVGRDQSTVIMMNNRYN